MFRRLANQASYVSLIWHGIYYRNLRRGAERRGALPRRPMSSTSAFAKPSMRSLADLSNITHEVVYYYDW